LLLGTSNFADLDLINILAKKYNYKIKILIKKRMSISGHKNFKNYYLILEFIKIKKRDEKS
jgi:hypothetical protein